MPQSDSPQPIRIFRPGTFTSVEGTQVSFGAGELQAIADAYDAAADPAPLVIGHPRIEDPAYGWVDRLAVEDGALVAYPGDVEPSFAELVRQGRYRKVSAQLYPPDHPANPKPGGWSLKHVGFLGAHAPGVKGLGTVSLAAGDAGDLITIINQETVMSDKKTGEQPKGEDQAASFAEREAALAEREAGLKKREDAAAKAAADARHADHVSFAEGLVKDAKLAPAGKAKLVAIMDRLGETPDVVSFGEGDGDKLAPVAALKSLLSGAKPLVSLGEAAPAEKGGGAKVASFAAPPGYDVDPEQLELHAKARALMVDNPNLTLIDAVRRVSAS